jgi:hypothetical protein
MTSRSASWSPQLTRFALQLVFAAIERVALLAGRGQSAIGCEQTVALTAQRGELAIGAVQGGGEVGALGGVRVLGAAQHAALRDRERREALGDVVYVNPGPAAVAEITGLLDSPRRSH